MLQIQQLLDHDVCRGFRIYLMPEGRDPANSGDAKIREGVHFDRDHGAKGDMLIAGQQVAYADERA